MTPPKVPNFKKAAGRLYAAPAVALKLVRKFADKELLTFRHRVENGEFPAFDATPLSDDWLAFKAANDLDLRTMIATGHYIKEMKVFVERTATGYTVYVGFDAAARAVDPVTKEPTPFPLHLLAAVQEYGSAKANVPPRPHWAPHLADMAKRAGGVRVKVQQAVLPKGK